MHTLVYLEHGVVQRAVGPTRTSLVRFVRLHDLKCWRIHDGEHFVDSSSLNAWETLGTGRPRGHALILDREGHE